jgi:UDP-N-acetylglucosamine 2-epimerase
VAGSSFKRIPSVNAFKVVTGEQNNILLDSGLERKLPAQFDYKVIKDQNRLNKYMEHQIKSLRKMLENGKPEIF